MSDKVTVRFESTMDSANSEPLLLSGPIQIFASVDVLDELKSPELIMAVKDAIDLPQIVVFVSDVGSGENDQTHRGAYFLYIGNRNDKSLSCMIERDWQEILLGSHSHENKTQLDNLANLPFGETEEDKLLAVDKDGNFKLVDVENMSTLPPLPPEFVNKINEINAYRNLTEPEDSEWHHLDAGLDELMDTYDWLSKDENGNYENLAVGNCRDLYHSLIKSDKPLFIDETGSLNRESGLSKLALEVFNVNFSVSTKKDGYENVILDSTNSNRTLLKVSLPCTISETDQILLFINGKVLSNEYYELVNREPSAVTIRFNRAMIDVDEAALTVLISRGSLSFMDLRDFFVNGTLTLTDINSELIALYIEGEFNRKPYVPQLYLTTDQYGTIYWDNKLLPTQHFYANRKVLSLPEGKDSVELKFENVNYNTGDGDFLLLIEDNFFAFDLTPVTLGRDVVFNIPAERFQDDMSNEYTLIVIRQTAGGSLANEIAENYISKEDAVKILSHGRINLNDYAKATDLLAYSRVGHTHSQYALKDHDHDHKYANYRHTHPELTALLVQSTGHSVEDVDRWIRSLTSGITNQIESALRNQKLHDHQVQVETNVIDLINEKIARDKYNITDFPVLPSNAYLNDVLEYIIKFFEHDSVKAGQVVFDYDIPVKFKVGGITKSVYKQGTTMEEIIQDILNPYISQDNIKKILTPIKEKSYLKWYKKNVFGEMVEVDPLRLKYDDEGALYFKVFFKNYNNEPCEFTVIRSGMEELLKTEIVVNGYSYEVVKGDKYFVYDNSFDFTETKDEYPEINISWSIKDDIVWDNYGLNSISFNPDGDSFTFEPEFVILFADYIAGSLQEVDTTSALTLYSLPRYIGSNVVRIDVGENNFISIIIDSTIENFKIIEQSSKTDITGFFEEVDNSVQLFGRSYTIYYYEVLNNSIEYIDLEINMDHALKGV